MLSNKLQSEQKCLAVCLSQISPDGKIRENLHVWHNLHTFLFFNRPSNQYDDMHICCFVFLIDGLMHCT